MKTIEELKNIIHRFYFKYEYLSSAVENIMLSCGASGDDSSDEGYFAGMTDSQIKTCYNKIRDLIRSYHENKNPDYFTENTLIDFDLPNLVVEESFSIYEQLNKIDDKESLSEKYNVRTLKDVRKLQESSSKYTVENVVDFAREHVLDNNNWNDYDVELDGDKLSVTIWTEDEYGDETEKTFAMSIKKLYELVEDEDAFASYIDGCENSIDYGALGEDFYRRAEEELNKHFKCTGAFLEPSTQRGQGKTFLFADDMSFDGSFDFQTGEDYIKENDFEGFLRLCISSFTPQVEESLRETLSKTKPARSYKWM